MFSWKVNVKEITCWRERGGSQILRRRESLVLNKSFNTLRRWLVTIVTTSITALTISIFALFGESPIHRVNVCNLWPYLSYWPATARLHRLTESIPVPEFIDPVFTKTSPKRSFSLNRKQAFWLVSAKTGSIISGTGLLKVLQILSQR